jgi:hypothetical protein
VCFKETRTIQLVFVPLLGRHVFAARAPRHALVRVEVGAREILCARVAVLRPEKMESLNIAQIGEKKG